jgi:hypothetical protein
MRFRELADEIELGWLASDVRLRAVRRKLKVTFSVYTIHGSKDLEEKTLDHLAGHKNSKPVRIGNGAADHIQLVSLPPIPPIKHN